MGAWGIAENLRCFGEAMSTGQLIFVGLGIATILSSIDFSSLLNKIEKKVKEADTVNPTPVIVCKDNLVEIVQKWQTLKDACLESKLTDAVNKLDEIFPMLIKVDK